MNNRDASVNLLSLTGLSGRSGRYGEAWASLQREVVAEEHAFGRAVRDLGIGLYLAELFDNAGAVHVLTDVARRGRELHRRWIEDWAEAVKRLALARRGRVDELEWARLDFDPARLGAPRSGWPGRTLPSPRAPSTMP